MPYKMFKQGGKFCVKNEDTGESKGCSASKAMAVKHMRALYAAEGGAKMGKKELDDLVIKAIDEYNLATPDDVIDKSYMGYIPFDIITFSALDEFRSAQEQVDEINHVTNDFLNLTDNILSFTPVENRVSALKALTDEFAARVEKPPVEDKDLPCDDCGNKEIDEVEQSNFVDRIMSGVKDALKAILPNNTKSSDEDNFLIWKEADTGDYRWVGRHSNKFRDQSNPSDILSEKSHQRFVERVDKGLAPMPELWVWHQEDLKIGNVDWLAYDDSGFILSSGIISKEYAPVAEWLMTRKNVAMSHGMPRSTIVRDQDDPSIILEYESKELSVLPPEYAAAHMTGFVVLNKEEEQMAIPDAKKEQLKRWGLTTDLLSAIEQANQKSAEKAAEAGLESKEKKEGEGEAEGTPAAETTTEEAPKTETPTPAPDLTNYPTRQEVADAISAVVLPLVETKFGELTTRIEALSKSLEQSRADMEAQVQKTISQTPQASISSILFARAVGSKDAEVKESETISHPKITPPPATTGSTGVPFIDKMLMPETK